MSSSEGDNISQEKDLGLHPGVWRHLMVVLEQEHEDLQLLKLHLFTEQLLNEMISTYLRTDDGGLRKLRLGYSRKVELVELAHLVSIDGCELLRKLNRLRQKLAHHLTYTITDEDRKTLTEGIAASIREPCLDVSVFRRLAPFLGGYLSGGIKMARIAAERLSTISRNDFNSFGI